MGVKYVIGMNFCIAVLYILFLAVGIGVGDEVIIILMIFAVIVNIIIYIGVKFVLVDIELESGCIDVNKIEEKIIKKIKVIVLVYYGG